MTEALDTIERAFLVRCRIISAQVRRVRRIMGAKRFVWNWALGESNLAYREIDLEEGPRPLLKVETRIAETALCRASAKAYP